MAIVLTQLSYYYSGLKDEHLFECFKILVNVLDNPVVEFDSWMSAMDPKERPNMPYSSINLKFSHQQIKLFNALRKNMDTIDFWLSHSVFRKELKNYPDKITCSAWDICSSKNRTSGFSGTNDMSVLLPLSIIQKDLPELEKTNEDVREAVEKSDHYEYFLPWITTSVDVLHKLTDNNIQVLIDAGALMTDMTNFQVAVEWLKINKNIEAVIYFNEKDELTVRTRENFDCPFGLSPYSEKFDLCAVYLDDEHTRGTDLRFLDGTIGCVTLGGRMTRDKLVQACMRLRLLQSGRHKVFFLASRESHNQIQGMMPHTVKTNSIPTAVDVMNWVCKNTEDFKKEGLVFWANSGLNFAKMQVAVSNFKERESYPLFSQEIQERSVGPVTYKTQSNFLEVLAVNFEAAQQTRIESLTSNATVESKTRVMGIQKSVLDVISREIPDKRCFSNNLDEEQEREIENEVEEEREISRPRPETPHPHHLHPVIKQFIQHGILQQQLNTEAFEGTRLPGLYATKDFLKVAVSGRILRPVNWIASGVDPTGKAILLLLSPYEVNELKPEYKDPTMGQKGATIHMFSPRLRPDQSVLLNNSGLQLCGDIGIKILAGEALANLHIYAGSLYFDPKSDEEKYYRMVVEKLEEEDPDFEVMSFIKKTIEDRHQHFPKCDVYKFLKQ